MCDKYSPSSAAFLPRRGVLLYCLCSSAAGLLACVDSVCSQRDALLLFGVLINGSFLKLQFVELFKLQLISVLQLGFGYTNKSKNHPSDFSGTQLFCCIIYWSALVYFQC